LGVAFSPRSVVGYDDAVTAAEVADRPPGASVRRVRRLAEGEPEGHSRAVAVVTTHGRDPTRECREIVQRLSVGGVRRRELG